MKKLFIVLSILYTCPLYSQSSLPTYKFSGDIAKSIALDSNTDGKYQYGAMSYNISAYYKLALETMAKDGMDGHYITRADSLYFNQFKPVNAKDYILQRARNEKIIIINEAHHNARHRTFTHSLLQGLYDNGYRYLGLEALRDSLINERRFPTISSGFYTTEPEFGNLIYAAEQIGFTVFGYEAAMKDFGTPREREIAQAKNIVNFINTHKPGKLLIHCGYGHVNKVADAGPSWGKAMAGRLKEFSLIDPFTIDQVANTEKSDPHFNEPYIAMVNADKPVIMVDPAGHLFNASDKYYYVDCYVIHPATKYIHQRPDWLLNGTDKQFYKIPDSLCHAFPMLALAYRAAEPVNEAVPSDIIEITADPESQYMLLPKGRYQIVLKDRDYNVIGKWEKQVD